MKMFEIDDEGVRVVDETLTIREDVVVSLEASDELLELEKHGVAAGGGGVRLNLAAPARRELRLVAVVHSSFVPTRHFSGEIGRMKNEIKGRRNELQAASE